MFEFYFERLKLNHKKYLVVFFLIIVVSSVFSVVSLYADEPVTIRMAIWTNDEDMKIVKLINEQFDKDNPNIKLKMVYLPDNASQFNQKMMTMAVGNTLPDVFNMFQSYYLSFATKNVLLDLRDLVQQDPDWPQMQKLWFPGALNLCYFNGGLYAFPRDIGCWFIAYNKDMFDAAGVPYPTEDWTWDDYFRISQKLTKKDANGNVTQFGTCDLSFGDVAFSDGVELVDPVTHAVNLTNPAMCEAMQWCADLEMKYNVAPGNYAASDQMSAIGGDPFLGKRVAMDLFGQWLFGIYKKICDFNWDITTLPQGKAGHRCQFMFQPICISKTTTHPKEAYQVIKYFCFNKKLMELTAAYGFNVPVRMDVAHSKYFMQLPVNPKHIDLFIKSLEKYAVPPFRFINEKELMDLVNQKVALLHNEESYSKYNACDLMASIVPKFTRKLEKTLRRLK